MISRAPVLINGGDDAAAAIRVGGDARARKDLRGPKACILEQPRGASA
jgi:hypothetical protein